MEPRSFPSPRRNGRRNGELLVDEGASGERYDMFARFGRKGRGGVRGRPSRSVIMRNRGRAGVGAVGEATVESMYSTSWASRLSRLSPSANAPGVGVTDERCSALEVAANSAALREDRCPKGDSALLRRGLGLGVLLRLTFSAGFFAFTPVRPVRGVRGEDADEEADDGGRADCEADEFDEVFAVFEGRAGLPLRGEGEGGGDRFCAMALDFFSGVWGPTLIAFVRFTFNAEGWGTGLIDRPSFPAERGSSSVAGRFSSVSVSLSSSALGARDRRVIRVGEDTFFVTPASPSIDLGLYLGSADVPFDILGRREVVRESVVLGVWGDEDVSSESVTVGFFSVEALRV